MRSGGYASVDLEEETPYLLRVRSRGSEQGDLFAWLSGNAHSFSAWMHKRGAAIFRGFDVNDHDRFREVALAIMGDLGNYVGGDAPRSAVTENVYDATSFQPDLDLGLHNELSYSGAWPTRIAFCALAPAKKGGQTTVASGRHIYSVIDPDIRGRFETLGITYHQHLRNEGSTGGGKSWQETFETASRTEVEKICTRLEMTLDWTAIGLRTSRTNTAVRFDPRSGHTCWFNQADLWHAEFDDLKDRALRSRSIDLSRHLGSHATFGDGSEIPVESLREVRQAYARCEVAVDWQVGDVLVLNNETVLHGRRAYDGFRRILVAMDRF